MQVGKFNTVVDSAWGSSAKGAASTRLVDIHKVGNVSCCNMPNAGHTVVFGDDRFISKAIPTPLALWRYRDSGQAMRGWIGPNSGFELDQFKKECDQLHIYPQDLRVHARAMIVEQRHKDAESPGGAQSTLHVSSTMSGSGAAFADKAMRGQSVEMYGKRPGGLEPWDFWQAVQTELSFGGTFLHEVSQGFALSVDYGTHYPFCTFRNCTPQQAYADFCLQPSQIGDVYLNVRTHPIRVGNNFDASGKQIGYSGDCMPDQRETSWEEVGLLAQMPQSEIDVLAEKERTTVTKKIRRVFTPSWQLLRTSAKMCGATKLILNFPQYIHWSAYKLRGGREQLENLHADVRGYINTMEVETGLPVVMIGTGPDHDDFIFLEDR